MKKITIRKMDLSVMGTLIAKPDSGDLQRTEEWLKARSGRWTGSKNKDLMGCGSSTAKKSWLEEPNKVYDFGKKTERHIYVVGKERNTGIRSMQIFSKQMNHGTEHEPLLIQKLIDDGIISDFEELGFEQFPTYENGGASVDGVAKAGLNIPKRLGLKVGEKVVLETKCCVSWDGHYSRMYEKVHEKHEDFWQFQSGMLATNTTKLLYVVAYPMTIEKYDISICEASPIHQNILLTRCKIADNAISRWGKEHSYAECLALAIAEFKEEGT